MTSATVLIADDNEPLRRAMAQALGTRGCAVLQAENGAEAVRLAQQHRPDLILLDLMMPVLNGLGAARALQENPATAHIPRVAITASDFDPTIQDALAASFDRVLGKPLRLRDLFGAMEELLAERMGQP